MKIFFQLATSILTPILVTSPMRAAMQSSEPTPVTQIHISVVDRDAGSAPVGSVGEKGFTVLVADSAGAPVSESAVVFRLPEDGPGGSFADSSRSAIVYTSANGLARISGINWSDTPGLVAIRVTATKGDARAGILLTETLTPKAAPSTPAIVQQSFAPASEKHANTTSAPQSGSTAVQPGVPVPQVKAALPRASDVPQPLTTQPVVSVVNSQTADTGYHASHKKWIILAAIVAAAAGAGVAVGAKGKSSSKTSTSGVSVGAPTVSVGQP